MSTHTPRSSDIERGQTREFGDGQHSRTDVRRVAARVATRLACSPDANPPDRSEALDTRPRRWDAVDPSATRIGRAEDPENDLGEHLRVLHAERDARLRGNEERRQRLDVARITQALCNSLDLTAWERDRVLGVVCELDPDSFGDRRTVPAVVLAIARRVVDAERRAWLGLEDEGWVDEQPSERIETLSERRHRLAGNGEYERLLASFDLTPAAVDRVEEVLEREFDDGTFAEAVFGRSLHRDPCLPPFEPYASVTGRRDSGERPGPGSGGPD